MTAQDMGLELIEVLICEAHGVTPLNLKSSRTDEAIVKAREDFACMARDMQFSYPAIGRALNKHHTAVMHMVRRAGAII